MTTCNSLLVGFAFGVIIVLLMINVAMMAMLSTRSSGSSPVGPIRDSDQVVLVVIQDPDDLRVNPAPVAPPRRLAVERSVSATPAPPLWGTIGLSTGKSGEVCAG